MLVRKAISYNFHFNTQLFCEYFRSEEFEHSQLDDKKWMDEYKQTNPSELSKTANELLGTINDPKLTNSEVNVSHRFRDFCFA